MTVAAVSVPGKPITIPHTLLSCEENSRPARVNGLPGFGHNGYGCCVKECQDL